MPKLLLSAIVLAFTAAALWNTPAMAGTWTGEVVDLKCALSKGATDRSCGAEAVKAGQPMGLLTDDGTLVLLKAKKGEGETYEALKARFGKRVQISGSLAERDGMKVITVTGLKSGG